MIIELPYELGDKVFHLKKLRIIGVEKPDYTIIPCVVNAVHFGRVLKGIGDRYIQLQSTNTGYMSCHISFDDFESDCFKSFEEARNEMQKRINEEAKV